MDGNISARASFSVVITLPQLEQIYRSIGPGDINQLASGSVSKLLTIDGSGKATFSGVTIPNNVGVGDVIFYEPIILTP